MKVVASRGRVALLALALLALCVVAGCTDASERRRFGSAGSGDGPIELERLDALGDECQEPTAGCPCAGNQPPIACQPEQPPAPAPGEEELCYEGTRSCDQGVWSECLDVRAYRKPSASPGALVDQVSDHPSCSDCDLNCFRVTDAFNPDDGALDPWSSGLSFHGSGAGVTLTPALLPPDAGVPLDAGLPDDTLVLPLQEGLVSSGVHQTLHRPRDTDVYFLLDQSLTMAEETLWIYDRMVGGDNYVTSGLSCTSGDPSVADNGISGALECMIDGPGFGVGMLRDIPFDPYATDTTLPAAAQDADTRAEIAFRHHADVTSDPDDARAAMSSMGGVQSSGDPDVAGSQIPALYSVATGTGHFMGLTRTAVPDQVDCPPDTSGYPCFPAGSRPLVMLVTDAPMHNGPGGTSISYDYDPADLAMQVGTSTTATTVPSDNDDFTAPFPLSSDAGNELGVFLGDTAEMSAAVPASVVSCGAHDAAADAVFSFSVTGSGSSNVLLSAQGTEFDAALAVYDGPPTATEVLAPVDDDNELFTSAHDLGDVRGRRLTIGGDTTDAASPTDMGADYQGSLYGASCGANTLAPDAVYRLDVASATGPVDVNVSLDMGSDRPVLAIYQDGAGPLPRWPVTTAPIPAAGNTNAELANVFDIPTGAGNAYLSISGTTAGLDWDYEASELGGSACSPEDTALDAGFHIRVDGTQRLRFDTEGSSFDTVLSLHDRPPVTKDGAVRAFTAAETHDNENEDAASAWPVDPVDGRTQTFQGDTTGMDADIGDTFGCGMDSACGDAVYRIDVLNRTTLRFEVAGMGYEPAVVVTRADPAGVSGRYPPIALGGDHGCAVSAGQVFCWGADDAGQLGDGGGAGDPDAASAVQAGSLTRVLNVCAGGAHSCAVDEQGRVFCWGDGASGQLGDGNANDAYAPVQVTDIGDGAALGRAVQVACGDSHSCALLEDGRIACWGSDASGQLGDGMGRTAHDEPSLVASSERFEQLAAGSAHTCAIRSSDDAVFCWGEGASGQLGNGGTGDAMAPEPAIGTAGATHIMTGGQHSCAVLSSGRVMCWGRGAEGQLGQGGDRSDQTAPVAVLNLDGSGFLANTKGGFAAGRAHSCVTSLEGFVRCWGDNSFRQMGNDDGASAMDLPIVTFDILDALTVVAGRDHSCALRADGTVSCWGDAAHRKLGDGMTSTPSRPVRAHGGGSGAVDFGNGSLDAAFTQDCHSLAQPPEDGCSYGNDEGHAYFFCNDHARTWAGAAQACEAVGLQLVDVDEAGENAFVASGIDDRSWIGVKRESSDDWTTLSDNLDFEDIGGDPVWVTEVAGHDSCFLFWCSWTPTQGYFTSNAAPDLVDSDPWTSSSTWSGDDQPSTQFGHNCVTLESDGTWSTDNCTALQEPSGGCGFLGLGCLFGFLGDLIGGIIGIFSDWLGDLVELIFDSIGGVYTAPHFNGGVERDYVCEERDQFTEMTLDPGSYFVTVKGIDDGIAGNSCEGPYELTITDVGSPGGGFLACNDNGVGETRASVIETTLDDGDYYLVLKGKRAGDQGAYDLTVRDVGAVSTSEVACDLGSGVGDPASVRFTADPGSSYYALVKGDAPVDRGPYTLSVSDATTGDTRIACDATSGPDGEPQLSLDLAAGDYYAVLKGRSSTARGPYRLTLGGASPVGATYVPPTYAETVDALDAAGIRVNTVLSCNGGTRCDDARVQADRLAADTGGVVRQASSADDVPNQIVRSVELVESIDRLYAELLFTPDADPGLAAAWVEPVPDPGNLCTTGLTDFTSCRPGATPAFRVSVQDPALPPIPPSGASHGGYELTLRIHAERAGDSWVHEDVPVLVLPGGSPPMGSYSRGQYFQELDARGCDPNEGKRPSWDELYFDADVRPDTRIHFSACTGENASELATCGDRGVRVLTVSAGTGSGTPCTVATQDVDCPDGYCSPYTGICNYLEGYACSDDAECPGDDSGRCRQGPSFAELGRTCRVLDLKGDPAGALGSDNYRPHMRMTLDLESLGAGSNTPSVFFWETWYRCRDVE